VVLIAGLTVLWQTGQVAQAAVLDPHPGLVGWWRFDEGSGTVAGDSSGNGNSGTINGATWVNGRYGKALSFNGIDNAVDIHTAPRLINSSFTLMSWFNATQLSGTYQMFGSSVWDMIGIGLLTGTNKIFGQLNIGGGLNLLDTGVVPTVNTWYFVAMTFDASTGKVIVSVNAVNKYEGTSTSSKYDTAAKGGFYIGSHGSHGNPFKGIIDEVRIYNRALSAAEIQETFKKKARFFVKAFS